MKTKKNRDPRSGSRFSLLSFTVTLASYGKAYFIADNQLLRNAGEFSFVINHFTFYQDQRITLVDAEIMGDFKAGINQFDHLTRVGKP